MKTRYAILFVLVSGLLAAPDRALAQFAIDWFSIDGGGGTSSGSGYTITGTIGQPDAGVMRGYPYAIVGGFWSLVAAIPTPGISLDARLTETNSVLVSWPISAEHWVLRETSELGPASWVTIPPPYSSNATRYFIVVPMPVGNRFYQLCQAPVTADN